MATRIRLGELLVRAGVIDEMKLKAALAEQHRWGGRLGKILVDMNYVSEDLLVKALSKQLGVPRADLSRVSVPRNVMTLVSPEFAEQNGLCPVSYDEARRVLVVATSDPTNVTALDELRFQTGLRIETALAGDHEIHVAISHHLRPASHGIELEAIELDEADEGPIIEPDDAYGRVMAASGLRVDPARAGRGVAAPSAAPAPGASPFAPSPFGGPPARASSSPPPWNPTPPRGPSVAAAPSAGSALEMAGRLEGAQRQQLRALRVMVELLIEKGIISRDEYLARVSKR